MRRASQRRQFRVLHKKLSRFPLVHDFESGQGQKMEPHCGRCLHIIPQHLILPEEQMASHIFVPTEPSGVAQISWKRRQAVR